MLEGVVTALGSLLIIVAVLYLAYLASKYTAKWGNGRMATRNMKVIERMSLGKDTGVAIIKVKEDYLLVGISPNGISILKEFGQELDFTEEIQELAYPSLDFKSVLDKIKKREGR